ncbi:Arylesterase [uncultured archaeon]|nr:Arylesterase [uncultured archaeon]
MVSWQGYIDRIIIRKMYKNSWNAPVLELRQKIENNVKKNARWLRLPKNIEVLPVSVGGLPSEWIIPLKSTRDKVILYIHGGGHFMGSCNTYRALAAYIAEASNVRVLLLEYRLAPEHPFPTPLDDTIAGYRWLLNEGISPHNIVIAGDSAGGNLCLASIISLRDQKSPLPSAVVCLSPDTDLSWSGGSIKTNANIDPMLTVDVLSMIKLYIGNNDPCHPLISPLYADLHGLPPMLIQVGSHEIMLSDSTRFADKARNAGVDVTLKVWDGMWHVFQSTGLSLPEARQAINEIGVFVKKHLGV